MSADSHAPYRGQTYYGQSQLKPSPFGVAVSLYIYIAGLSGSAQMLATIGDLAGGQRAQGMVRRGRLISMLATVFGPALLIWDLHTPKRFYNMLRILRRTSPMSLGSYALSGFGLASTIASLGRFVGERIGGRTRRLLRAAEIAASVPAAVAGSGLSVYTAALQSATSTPYWAAAPRGRAIRYGAAAVATAAAARSLLEPRRGDPGIARALDWLALGALAVETVAHEGGRQAVAERGVAAALSGERVQRADTAVVALGTILPAGLYAASLLLGARGARASGAAALLTLAGGLAMRHQVMAAGNASARSPQASFAFAQPRR